MTLYLKYRPKNLDELDLLDVGESLKKIFSSGHIPHAFLFAGPKGTGKTSAARILAKIINCRNLKDGYTPCDNCEECLSIVHGGNLDVIEMDAASHRGIDDIRALKDAVKLAPTKSKTKVYIIDEAHMLTTEASNALLKTLEEPPEHVIFILATTNPEKLIDTIKSRTTLISFRKANTLEITRSLKRVVEAEKIKITDEALTKISEIAGGAFRDAIKMLEQVNLEGESYLDTFKTANLENFIKSLIKKDSHSAIMEVEEIANNGQSVELFLKDVLTTFHQALLSEVGLKKEKLSGIDREDLVKLIEIFSEASKNLPDSPIEQLSTEIAIIKWSSSSNDYKPDIKKDDPAPVKDEKDKTQINTEKKSDEPIVSLESEVRMGPVTPEVIDMGVNNDIWKNILLAVRPINASIEGLLRASKPVSYDGKVLTLGVFYKFHKERLEDIRHRKVLEGVIEKILNTPTKVVCTLVEPPTKIIIEEAKKEPVLTETKDADIIKVAEEIFGN